MYLTCKNKDVQWDGKYSARSEQDGVACSLNINRIRKLIMHIKSH